MTVAKVSTTDYETQTCADLKVDFVEFVVFFVGFGLPGGPARGVKKRDCYY